MIITGKTVGTKTLQILNRTCSTTVNSILVISVTMKTTSKRKRMTGKTTDVVHFTAPGIKGMTIQGRGQLGRRKITPGNFAFSKDLKHVLVG
jgi:hypothetical protein